MSHGINKLREADCIASVEKSQIDGVDYHIVGEEGVKKQDLRVLWLSTYRDEYEWVGESEHHVEPAFAMLTEREQ